MPNIEEITDSVPQLLAKDMVAEALLVINEEGEEVEVGEVGDHFEDHFLNAILLSVKNPLAPPTSEGPSLKKKAIYSRLFLMRYLIIPNTKLIYFQVMIFYSYLILM